MYVTFSSVGRVHFPLLTVALTVAAFILGGRPVLAQTPPLVIGLYDANQVYDPDSPSDITFFGTLTNISNTAVKVGDVDINWISPPPGITNSVNSFTVTGYTLAAHGGNNDASTFLTVQGQPSWSQVGVTTTYYGYMIVQDSSGAGSLPAYFSITVPSTTVPMPELSSLLGFGSFVVIGGFALLRRRKFAREAA